MRKWRKLRQIAASAMAAVMMVTAMPMGGVAYGDVVSGEEILGAEEKDEILASGSNCEYGKVSDSDAKSDSGTKTEIEQKPEAVSTLINRGIELFATETMEGIIQIDNDNIELQNEKYVGKGYEIQKNSDGTYKLTLAGFNGQYIQIFNGEWEINISGDNTVSGYFQALNIADAFNSGAVPKVEITGDGKLELSGTVSGIVLDKGTSLVIDGDVKVQASGSGAVAGTKQGIWLDENSVMTVKNGTVTATGTGDSTYTGTGIQNAGKIVIEGGRLEGSGSTFGVRLENGKFDISGGELKTDKLVTTESSEIKLTGSGKIEADTIELNNGGTMTVDGESAQLICSNQITVNGNSSITLNAGEIKGQNIANENQNGFNLNGGTLDVSGIFSGNSLNYTSGTIRGSGNFSDDVKLKTEIKCNNENPQTPYSDNIDVSQYFIMEQPDRSMSYFMDTADIAENERGVGTLSGSTLNVSKVGKFKITAVVEADNFYASASKTITLNVSKASLDGITVTPYKGTYDGESHPAVTVEMNGESLVGNKQYRILYVECTDLDTGINSDMYSDKIPTVKNVSDTGKNYQVLIQRENYSDEVIGLGEERVDIKPSDMASVTVSLAEDEYIYNRNEQAPVVEAKLMKDGQTIETLTDNDYTVTWRSDNSDIQLSMSGKPINTGRYYAELTAKVDGNFTGTIRSSDFEIKRKELRAELEGNLTKTYDGTTKVNYNDSIKIVLKDRNNEIENWAEAVAGGIQYDNADAGTDKTVTVWRIDIKGNVQENYKLLNTEAAAAGTILNADLQNVSVRQEERLTYTGRPQSALISTTADVPYGENKNVVFTYATSKDGTYETTVPTFTDAGSHTVYYKASLKNYNDWEGEFEVKIEPADLSGAALELSQDQAVYNGKEQKPEVKVTLNGIELPKEDYEIEFRQGSEAVTPKAAGTYTVAAYGKGNLLGTNTPQKTFTIKKAKAPVLDDIKVSYSFGATGTKTVDIVGLPDDIGTYFGAVAEVSSDAIHALGNGVTVDGTKVTFELLGNKKENIGKTSEILVKNIETQNYEDAMLKILVTMEPKKDQSAVSSKMTFTSNSDDETFTAEIAKVDGAEYSFDGETWSNENQKVDCFADTSYTGYIRMKETEELYAGPETAVTAVSPKAYAKTPVITPDGGSFWSKQEVVIESATKGAKIYYTLDGTEPTTESSLYTAPFELREKATVKAIAVKEHLENSAVATAEFTRNYSSSDSDDYEPESGKGTSGNGSTVGTANGANTDNGTITKDDVKGAVSSVNGVITGATNSTENDGYSHWMKDENGWWLRYSDGSYPKGTKSSGSTSDTSYGWEQINGAWWAFDENGYMRSGWVLDAAFGGWFYINEDHGMQAGWFQINGKWYYLNPASDGRRGIMYAGMKTPDGWYVGEDGSWDGLAKQ